MRARGLRRRQDEEGVAEGRLPGDGGLDEGGIEGVRGCIWSAETVRRLGRLARLVRVDVEFAIGGQSAMRCTVLRYVAFVRQLGAAHDQ